MWLTDIHLDFINLIGLYSFRKSLIDANPDMILVGGDIAEANSIISYLEDLERFTKVPIYFVLGNHDYFRGSIAGTRARIAAFSKNTKYTKWLNISEIVTLNPHAALIGHDGWSDAEFGNFLNSPVQMPDYDLIEELSNLSKLERKRKLKELGIEAAEYLQKQLQAAFEDFEHVYFLTHVPPFAEACWHLGEISNPDWLPHFTCKAMGDVILETMKRCPEKSLTVLCGHTHSSGKYKPRPNITVYTGHAEYGAPEIQRVFEV